MTDQTPKGKIFFRPNQYKEPGTKQPDYKGTIQIPVEMLRAIQDHHYSEFRGVEYVTFEYGIWEGEEEYMMGSVQLPMKKKEEPKPERGKPWKKKGETSRTEITLPF